jgi:hypothetical protein
MTYLLAALGLGAACVLWFLVQRASGTLDAPLCGDAGSHCGDCAQAAGDCPLHSGGGAPGRLEDA